MPQAGADLLGEGLGRLRAAPPRGSARRRDAARRAARRRRPSTSGASGPTITKSMRVLAAEGRAPCRRRGCRARRRSPPRRCRHCRARTQSRSHGGFCANAQASACSRPPPPRMQDVHRASRAWPRSPARSMVPRIDDTARRAPWTCFEGRPPRAERARIHRLRDLRRGEAHGRGRLRPRPRARRDLGGSSAHASGHFYFDLKDDRRRARRGRLARHRAAACASSPRTAWRSSPPAGSRPSRPSRSTSSIVDDDGAGRRRRADGDARGSAGRRSPPRACSTPTRKRPLPYLPEVIGVVTSPTGAVIRDILHRLARPLPAPRAALAGARAGRALRRRGRRGHPRLQRHRRRAAGAAPRPPHRRARRRQPRGPLGRSTRRSSCAPPPRRRIPLISAVGHETDTTLIDFAADRRAPTPTAAAEMAVPVRLDLLAATAALEHRRRNARRARARPARPAAARPRPRPAAARRR